MRYPIKMIRSNMRGAPTLNGTPGSTIAVHDACLLTGFGEVQAVSLTISNGVATAVVPTDGTFLMDTTLWVSGASLPSMNEEQVVTGISSNSVSWKTLEADQVVTGTIMIKVAPLGWSKPFAATSIAAYRSLNPLSTQTFIRLDDRAARSCLISCYENMNDIDTGFEAIPPVGTAGYWTKSLNADTSKRDWVIIGGDKWWFWAVNRSVQVAGNPHANALDIQFVGDFRKLPDSVSRNNFLLHAHTSAYNAENDGYGAETIGHCDTDSSASRCRWVRRGYGGAPGATRVYTYPNCVGTTGYSGVAFYVPFPNPSDGGLRLVDQQIHDAQSVHYGQLPCVKIIAHNANAWNKLGQMTIVPGTGPMLGRRFLIMRMGSYSYNAGDGCVAFDLTGPTD